MSTSTYHLLELHGAFYHKIRYILKTHRRFVKLEPQFLRDIERNDFRQHLRDITRRDPVELQRIPFVMRRHVRNDLNNKVRVGGLTAEQREEFYNNPLSITHFNRRS